MGLLLTNALAILHEKRFLPKVGWVTDPLDPNSNSLKSRFLGLVHAVQFLRVPLIAINSLVILMELVLG